MRILNFTIEEDRNGYILTEFKTYTEGENAGDEYVSDTTYPTTLERALLKVLHRSKKSLTESKDLGDAINRLKTDREEFLLELRKEIKGQ